MLLEWGNKFGCGRGREMGCVCGTHRASWQFMLLRSHRSPNQRHEKTIWQLRWRGNGALQESLYFIHKTFPSSSFFSGLNPFINETEENCEGREREGKIGFYNAFATWPEKWDATEDDVDVARMNIDLSARDKKPSQTHWERHKWFIWVLSVGRVFDPWSIFLTFYWQKIKFEWKPKKTNRK